MLELLSGLAEAAYVALVKVELVDFHALQVGVPGAEGLISSEN